MAQPLTAHPPPVHRALAGLARAELAGVNPHTLALALSRAERDGVPFERMDERQAALALLERVGYPESVAELNLFLNVPQGLAGAALLPDQITGRHALQYVRWLAGFLNDPEPDTQRNARLLLRWLVATWGETIAADQSALDSLRQVADDPQTGAKCSACIVYALGVCGTLDDYDRVIRHAEQVIEHDLEHLDLVAEGLHRLYPPALVNALVYFLDHAPGADQKQFATGIHLLARVADIEDQTFWSTYHAEMSQLLDRLEPVASRSRAIEHIHDQIEKRLAQAAIGED
jgi:hypothetical protein